MARILHVARILHMARILHVARILKRNFIKNIFKKVVDNDGGKD